MHGLIASSPTGDWSYGAAILSFAFPMVLVIVVTAALYIVYTTPHLVPGHRYRMEGHVVAGTPGVAVPGQGGQRAAGGGQAPTAGGTGG